MSRIRRFLTANVDERGFTLMEMVIAIALTAVIFTALAGIMASGLRVLGVQKARTQGNEVATQGIEDLQRYTYSRLALCGPPPGSTPVGLEDTVISASPNCPVTPSPAQKAKTGDDPCNPSATPIGVPKAMYSCTRINITYDVRRYIAWTDAGHTAKRLAVFVTWKDAVGTHEVSQQTSLRAPAGGDVEGVDPPVFVDPKPGPSRRQSGLTTEGKLINPIGLTATTTGLPSTSDRVFIGFTTVASNGELTSSSVALARSTTLDGKTSWTGEIPANTRVFPNGSQFLTFNAVRASDGKTASLIDVPASKFCPGTDEFPICPTSLPLFNTNAAGEVPQSSNPLVVKIDSTGALLAPVKFTATTTNLMATDRVNFRFLAKTGSVTSEMVAINTDTNPCTLASCTWEGAISPSSGFSFTAGTRAVYFTSEQLSLTSSLSTGAAPSTPVEFKITTT